jgi:hypothetical protein
LGYQKKRGEAFVRRVSREALRNMNDPIMVRDWDTDAFHERVLEFEAHGYLARRETYKIVAEVDPDTGTVTHLHTIEMCRPG